jgi:hypothetical protein
MVARRAGAVATQSACLSIQIIPTTAIAINTRHGHCRFCRGGGVWADGLDDKGAGMVSTASKAG